MKQIENIVLMIFVLSSIVFGETEIKDDFIQFSSEIPMKVYVDRSELGSVFKGFTGPGNRAIEIPVDSDWTVSPARGTTWQELIAEVQKHKIPGISWQSGHGVEPLCNEDLKLLNISSSFLSKLTSKPG